MTQPGSTSQSQVAELFESAREARGRARETVRRAEASGLVFGAAVLRHQQAWARAERLRELWLAGRHDRVRYSASARLQARLDGMPVMHRAGSGRAGAGTLLPGGGPRQPNRPVADLISH
jgi:hypothetical protein